MLKWREKQVAKNKNLYMENSIDINIFISLLLIKKVESFRDSYSLTRVLEWKFKIINVVNLMNKLISQELIDVKNINQINYFEITSIGRKYVDENLLIGKELMLKKYHNEESFIRSLFE